MANRVCTVAELAHQAHIDADEMLIRLWDAGLDRYLEPGDKIRRRDMTTALSVARLPTKRELTSIEYWMGRLDVSQDGLRELIGRVGLTMSPGAHTLPKGSISRLKKLVAAEPSLNEQAEMNGALERADKEGVEAVVWRTIGHPRQIRCLSESEVEAIHWELVEDFALDSDPIDPAGSRNPDLLASAVFRQHTSFGDLLKYPSVEMAAGALLHAIVHDHPFHNGNKRTALVATLVLLDENGLMIKQDCPEEDLFALVLRLAQHRIVPAGRDLPDREMLHLAEWIRSHTRHIERGDRPVQWRRLKQTLARLGCELAFAPSVARMNITRVVEEPRRLRSRRRTLSTQVKFTDDGREAQVHTVKKIRRELWLDEEHGVDSQTFYGRGDLMPSAFIVKYRRTLKRLAKL